MTKNNFCRPRLHLIPLATILSVAVALGGCGARSNQRVRSMSIVSLPASINLLGDGSFGQAGFGSWLVRGTAKIRVRIDRNVHLPGSHSFELIADHAHIARSVVLEQEVDAPPRRQRGSMYTLRLRVKTIGLNRSVQTELRLNYADGRYEFFRGATSRPQRSARRHHRSLRAPNRLPKRLRGRGIAPGTSAGWLQLVVRATARSRVRSISVFALDTGPGRLDGTIWVDNVVLRSG